MKFFTQWQELGSMYSDPEYNSGEIVTDKSCYEPLERTIARALRGELVTGASNLGYAITKEMPIAEQLATEDVTRQPNFDYADADALARRINSDMAELKRQTEAKALALRKKAEEDAKKKYDNDVLEAAKKLQITK